MYNIKLPSAYSDFTMHMQSQLMAASFVGTKVGFLHDVPFSLMHVHQNGGFELTPPALCTSESGVISIIFEKAIHCFSK